MIATIFVRGDIDPDEWYIYTIFDFIFGSFKSLFRFETIIQGRLTNSVRMYHGPIDLLHNKVF